jgi:uncharacterized protein (TIGR01244 family)
MLRHWAVGVCTVAVTVFGCVVFAGTPESPSTNRPVHWARPIQLAGVPNLHQVTTNLYRSAQPTADGMRRLKALGIKTVINLRSFNSDRDEIKNTGLDYVHISMKAWHPEEKEAIRFLRLVTDPARCPVLVHCQHGADRTGAMCAVYRGAVQGWTRDEAVTEMLNGGFGFHGVWKNLIKWINGLDFRRMLKEAGIAPRSDSGK